MLELDGFRQVLMKRPELSLILLDHLARTDKKRSISCLDYIAVITMDKDKRTRGCPNPDCEGVGLRFRPVSAFYYV